MKLKVAAKIVLKHDDQVLLMNNNGLWDFPGGGIEGDERLIEALRREIREETGIEDVEIGKMIHADEWFIAERDLHVVAVFYEGTVMSRSQVQLSQEHTDAAWLTPAAVRKKQPTPETLRALEAAGL